MAYRYPADKIVDGEVIDPTPFNRTLGVYVGEISGMLDRDNFNRSAFTTAKIKQITLSSTSNGGLQTYEWTGPCNHAKYWSSTNTQTITALSSARFATVAGLGGTFTTLDSAIEFELSCGVQWAIPPGGTDPSNRYEIGVMVDGVMVASTGPVSAGWGESIAYLTGYMAVGAGTHTISVVVSVFFQYYSTPYSYDTATQNFSLQQRELMIEEARR